MNEGKPVVNMTGDLIAIGPVEREHVELHLRWLNDFGTLRTLGSLPAPKTREAMDELYQSTIVDQAEEIRLLTVYERVSMRPIGYTILQEIDRHHSTAEMTLAIGAAEFRGRGYGTETVRLTLEFGFQHLDLHNIMLRCYAFNLAGLRIYEKAGFREFARIREGFTMGHRRWDIVLMEALAPSINP